MKTKFILVALGSIFLCDSVFAIESISLTDVDCKMLASPKDNSKVEVRTGILTSLSCKKSLSDYRCTSSTTASDLKDKVNLTFVKTIKSFSAYRNESSNTIYYLDSKLKKYKSIEVYEALSDNNLLVVSKSCVGTIESK